MPSHLLIQAALLAVPLPAVRHRRADSLWTIKIYTRRLLAPDYAKLPQGAVVSDATTRRWLGLSDTGWFCEEPHRKGELLHLRHRVFQAKDVIVFIHGFIGDYVDTWGKPSVLLDDPRFNRNYDFVFMDLRRHCTAMFPRSMKRPQSWIVC
jgi:hypothetical protein